MGGKEDGDCRGTTGDDVLLLGEKLRRLGPREKMVVG